MKYLYFVPLFLNTYHIFHIVYINIKNNFYMYIEEFRIYDHLYTIIKYCIGEDNVRADNKVK